MPDKQYKKIRKWYVITNFKFQGHNAGICVQQTTSKSKLDEVQANFFNTNTIQHYTSGNPVAQV